MERKIDKKEKALLHTSDGMLVAEVKYTRDM